MAAHAGRMSSKHYVCGQLVMRKPHGDTSHVTRPRAPPMGCVGLWGSSVEFWHSILLLGYLRDRMGKVNEL